MMKLELMRAFFATVDQDWRSPIADEIGACWLVPPATVKCQRASANFVCQAKTREGQYFLRFNHASERRLDALEAELAFVTHLARSGIRVARPVASRAGSFVESVSTELGLFHAVLLEALPGRAVTLAELDGEGLARWGKALAEIHAASSGYASAHRPSWREHIQQAAREVPASDKLVQTELGLVAQCLDEFEVGTDDFGLIHYDFELDNIKWQGAEPGVLDFDDCALYWYEADIAYALRDLFDDSADGIDMADQRLAAFLKGYRAVRRLPDQALGRLPLFLRLHNLVSYAKLARALGSGPTTDEPEWAARLRERLARKMTDYRASFLAHPVRELVG